MNRRAALALTTMALVALAVALPTGAAVAQEKQHVSIKGSGENTKFTQQLNIDVGDAPNHILRVFEDHTTCPSGCAVINGVKIVEIWDRGVGDRIDMNGPATIYDVYVGENGDKFFVRNDGVVQNASGEFTITQVGHITGGTGKFSAMQGIARNVTNFSFKGMGASQTDIDYWFAQ